MILLRLPDETALSAWEQACDGKVPIDQCPILVNLYKTPNTDET